MTDCSRPCDHSPRNALTTTAVFARIGRRLDLSAVSPACMTARSAGVLVNDHDSKATACLSPTQSNHRRRVPDSEAYQSSVVHVSFGHYLLAKLDEIRGTDSPSTGADIHRQTGIPTGDLCRLVAQNLQASEEGIGTYRSPSTCPFPVAHPPVLS